MITEAQKRQVAGVLLAAWLAEHHPELFAKLQAQAAGTSAIPAGLAGFTDTLSSIWGTISSAASSVASGLGSAVKAVGAYVATPQGSSVLSSLATAYYGAKTADANVIAAQQQRAQAGQTPAPIQTVYDPASGAYVPVLTQPNASGTMVSTPLNPQLLASLQPSAFQQYGPWIIGGAILLGAVLYLRD